MRYHAWLQWVAEQQWNQVREQAKARGILLCGDEPFIIGQDSADTLGAPDILRRDARLGVPPDDFSATGQDWGLPYFDFAAMEKEDYRWLKARAAKAASYYDLRRVDHAVGYFRQWIRDEKTPTGRFIPPDEESHKRLGEQHFRLLSEDAGIIAEDLGVIPPFVRKILAELGLPGLPGDALGARRRRCTAIRTSTPPSRWSPRAPTTRSPWRTGGRPSATTSAPPWPRPGRSSRASPSPRQFTPDVHRAMLAAALNSSSNLCVLPWQDVLGTRERINLPGTMSDSNWAYRITQNVSALLEDAQSRERRRAACVAHRLRSPLSLPAWGPADRS